MQNSILADYHRRAQSGSVTSDPAQIAAIKKLEEIRAVLEASSERRKSPFALFARDRRRSGTKGLYLWGGVGAGKSMLMDLFFEHTAIERKKRVHFHAFMQDIHARIHTARSAGTDDPIPPIADAIAADARLLCFDELQITDITDAMIVGRLFEAMLARGTTIVSTSNRVPDDLYKDGLNRQLFLPFIGLLKTHMDVHHLFAAADYRQNRLRGAKTWFSPLSEDSSAALDEIWNTLADGRSAPLSLKVGRRSVTLPQATNGVARAHFSDLCDQPLGPADFLAIAGAVRALILEGIPVLSPARNNEAKRFVTLIDALYEAHTILIASAEAEPDHLYPEGRGAFEFERTASRLNEMRSDSWTAQP